MITAKKSISVRSITAVGMMSAVATVLMFLSFNVPLMPSFIKLDFSELPALIAAFSVGPWGGVTVCLVKNLINLTFSNTGGVGEMSNFLLGVCFVAPAGLIYRRVKGRKGAIIGSLVGALSMALVGVLVNFYIIYPVYEAFMPRETILGLYRAINPRVETLWDALLWFNMPFTFIKGMCSVGLTFLLYKSLSPLIKGRI